MTSSTHLLSNDKNNSKTTTQTGSVTTKSKDPLTAEVSEEVQDEINQMLDSIPQIDKFFKIINKIGSGTFSSVYVAELKKCSGSKELYALKHVIPTSHPSRIESELRCLYEIGGVDNVMDVKACFRERDHVIIVMPYFAHERFQDYVQLLSVAEVQSYMKNLLKALHRVHKLNIIHRDIKPSNFLYNRTQNRYSLVDFGLAQKAPEKSDLKSSGKHSGLSNTVPVTRKRKLSESDLENKSLSSYKRQARSDCVQNTSKQLSIIDVNKPHEPGHCQSATAKISTRSKLCSSELPEKVTSVNLSKSPRRMLLTKRAQHLNVTKIMSQDARSLGQRTSSILPATKIMSQDARSLGQRTSSILPATKNCACYGKPMICSVCMARSSQHAPRAGTPGFRAPEVLLKCPDQTTAIDVWSAGVIFLSLLSGRYPFFKASDDLTALAQIICIIGSEEMKEAALKFGKHLLCNPKTPPVDLEVMCKKLRRSTQPTRQLRLRGDHWTERLVNDWKNVPRSAFDLLQRLLDPNPQTRITAGQAIEHQFFSERLTCP